MEEYAILNVFAEVTVQPPVPRFNIAKYGLFTADKSVLSVEGGRLPLFETRRSRAIARRATRLVVTPSRRVTIPCYARGEPLTHKFGHVSVICQTSDDPRLDPMGVSSTYRRPVRWETTPNQFENECRLLTAVGGFYRRR